MGLHFKTMECNGLCRSCYESEIRSYTRDISYDVDAMIETFERETNNTPKEQRSGGPCVHGGEPLLIKFDDLEKILAKMQELYGNSNIQTNGILITDAHIELFKKYGTSIGVSLDGDTAQLNWGRWNAGNLTMGEIQKMTDKTLWNMKKCYDAGIGLSMISLLRKNNATAEHIDGFIRFLLRMREEFGIVHVRTNEVIIYKEEYEKDEGLTDEELGNAFCKIADVCLKDPELLWLPYHDVVNMLLGYINETTCTFAECDIWQTGSEITIMSNGSLGNCLKGGSACDGIESLRSDGQMRRYRYEMLEQIPQEFDGCKDCRYWFMCKGGCPGEGVDNDWRNRTASCIALKKLFAHIELKIRGMLPNLYTLPMYYPICPSQPMIMSALESSASTFREHKRKDIEKMKKQHSGNGQQHNDAFHGDSHRDVGHGDGGHGDSPHGDSHGDSHDDTSLHNNVHRDLHRDASREHTVDDAKPPKERLYSDIGHGNKGHGDRMHGDDHGDTGHGDRAHRDDAPTRKNHQDEHGDEHSDSHRIKDHDHGNAPHGDKPHGDS